MKVKAISGPYTQMQRLADLTKVCLLKGNISRASKCIRVADLLLQTGSAEVKCAVRNVFVYSVSAFMEWQRMSVRLLFPLTLQAEYYRQIHTADT